MLAFFNEISDRGYAFLGAGLAMFAILGVSVGQGIANAKAVEGIARNPETLSKLRTQFIIGAALTESGAIYCLIVAILLIFVA
ncbi:MAG: ATP synthase F0 subunit C [Malacoplasma sp.]|nr:ATP synthase F0 subunit C [Malacoplasma sp.]